MIKLSLAALRKNKGWSQEDAAKVFGVSKDTIFNYESGRTFPDVPMIEKIIKVYGVPYDGINFLPDNYDLTVNVI